MLKLLDDVFMRTTLTLEPDVALQLKRRMTEQKTAPEAVSERGSARGFVEQDRKPKTKFKVRAFPMKFKPGIDLDRISHLDDELEDERILKSMSE